jgi:hypothetical protein
MEKRGDIKGRRKEKGEGRKEKRRRRREEGGGKRITNSE